MDSERFDEMIRRLGTTRLTRGGVVRGLTLGAIVALASGTVGGVGADAKRKRRRRGHLRAQRADQANAGKVTICHFTDSESNPYVVIEISRNAFTQHAAEHDDFAINAEDGCCLDSDCTEFANSYCDQDAEGGAQCACAPTDRDDACAGNCGKTVSDGCGGEYTCDPCCTEVSPCVRTAQCCNGRICVTAGGGAANESRPGECRDFCIVNGGAIEAADCSAPTPTVPGQGTVGTSTLCCNPDERCSKRLSPAGDVRTQCG